jgi:hypothetical protein
VAPRAVLRLHRGSCDKTPNKHQRTRSVLAAPQERTADRLPTWEIAVRAVVSFDRLLQVRRGVRGLQGAVERLVKLVEQAIAQAWNQFRDSLYCE